jgi:hypothetical protein
MWRLRFFAFLGTTAAKGPDGGRLNRAAVHAYQVELSVAAKKGTSLAG